MPPPVWGSLPNSTRLQRDQMAASQDQCAEAGLGPSWPRRAHTPSHMRHTPGDDCAGGPAPCPQLPAPAKGPGLLHLDTQDDHWSSTSGFL